MKVIDYHGSIVTKSKIPEYRVWQQIRDRCKNEKNKCYPRYGGRGITVCDRWLVFENFIEDMGFRPVGGEKMTIERVDLNGNYEPENCIWATWKEQHSNTSRNRVIKFNGESKIASEWARDLNISRQCLSMRIKTLGEQEALKMGGNSKLM
jgi:hypothetical protein